MKVVLDTNVLLIAIPARSKYRPIFNAYLFDKISLVITTPIFFEYLEILERQSGKQIANYIENSFINASNVIIPSIYYYWDLIKGDADDNKFIDAYLAEDTDYLVTNDAHFEMIKKLEFPKVNIISADEFLEIVGRL